MTFALVIGKMASEQLRIVWREVQTSASGGSERIPTR